MTTSQLRVACFAVSLDGFGAGIEQSLEQPMGLGGMALHGWVFGTDFFQKMHGEAMSADAAPGSRGVDNAFALKGFDNIGAWILGRNMFGPVRGAWPDESWKGWWGDEPPYHCPVFVLSHYPRASINMKGGTVFHFVTGGIEQALLLARAAAAGKDVRLGGGVATVRQYLQAGLIDELHLAIAPTVLGQGESLFAGLNLPRLGYQVAQHHAGEGATHVLLRRSTSISGSTSI